MPEPYSLLIYFFTGFLLLSVTIYIWRKRYRTNKHVETSELHLAEPPAEVDEGEQQDVIVVKTTPVNEMIESKSRKIPLAGEIVEHYCSFLRTSPTILEDSGNIALVLFPPKGKRGWWTYATAGLSKVTGVELTLCSYNKADEIAESLSYINNLIMDQYDSNSTSVSSGNVFALPEPIVPNSHLSQMVIIPPYFEEDGFEFYIDREELVHVLALIPISEQEGHFCLTYGQSALEAKFEENECNTLDFFRESTV